MVRLLGGVLLMAASMGAAAQHLASLPPDLTQLDLDELMNIEVTSVSKRAEPLFQAAAAISVVTGEEIRRSGARTIPEALRGVPGLTVARIGDINTYAVSSRGFADRLSDKLEVLVDGRTVYTPLFSGVFWDTVDVPMTDIERIEVIRGPGATLWGTNAVNGVINVVTRSAAETRGGQLSIAGGTQEPSAATLRAGTAVGGAGDVRIYARHVERDALKDEDGGNQYTVQRLGSAGVRSDWKPAADHRLTLAGDLYDGARQDTFVSPPESGEVETSGGNFRVDWGWKTGPDSEVSARAYYDHSKRFIPTVVFRERRDIGDLELQHRIVGERNTLVYGASYRHSHDITGDPPLVFIFVPPSETLQYYGGFVQDQFLLTPKLELTAGSKFEHNDYTGWEMQPNLRLGATLGDSLFAWGAVSRAVRTPSRLDHDLAVLDPSFRVGNPDQKPEELLAYEAGTRWFLTPHLSTDLALFYNDYDDLRTSEANPPFGRFGNGAEGRGTGAELSLAWQPMTTLELRASYAQLHFDLEAKPGSTDTTTAGTVERLAPEHQARLHASWQPLPDWTTDALLRYQSHLSRTFPSGERTLPGYIELNLRVAWRPWPNLELGLLGENLLDRQHGEYLTEIEASYAEIPRSGLLEMIWAWD
jgi:iron complex outermembrane recepter protein